ncbi:hypothetical protein [Nocardia gipuzkoensis]|uniref:hypothetical protein n=1 Tax=Nocardia gipuzkoensis TaxID=2749991 RepID=UPI00237EE629|nr:hypothetical protein [Nocardia gipuzkoensis]MDE1674878.1 hypothetical protein [Nocardia gipuzkoensis]
MPRKGEYFRSEQAVEIPNVVARIGVREVVVRGRGGAVNRSLLDPRAFVCAGLVAELADEWVEHAGASELSLGAVRCYRRAITAFCAYVDERVPQAAEASLAGASPDLLAVILGWARQLPARHPAGSQEPAGKAWRLRTLIARRAQHPDRPLARQWDGWLTGSVGLRRGVTVEVDEFSRADKRAIIRAARADIRAVEQRLRRGSELLARGRDPRISGWLVPANLLWALDREIDSGQGILAHLPTAARWPPALVELVPPATPKTRWHRELMRVLSGMLYPTNLDLHGFRVLLMAATGQTSEEITGLCDTDVEFTPDGVSLTFTKLRARSIRRRPYPTVPHKQPVTFDKRSKLNVAELVERLMAVTARVRRRSGLAPAPLFLRINPHVYDLVARPFEGSMQDGSFRTWLAYVGVSVVGPADIRRLRKSGKVEKAIAYQGRISDVADDHTVQVFRGHYAHGTTLHVIAATVITTAQQRWLSEAITGPTVVTGDGEAALGHPQAPAVLGLTAEQVEELRSGALDMGVSSCRDPFDSPFGRSGHVCPVAPLRCLECRHALILPSNLPQLLLLSDHLQRLRDRLTPQHFHTLWGQSAANLNAVLAERSDTEIAWARRQIEIGEAGLHLPLTAHTEFDR